MSLLSTHVWKRENGWPRPHARERIWPQLFIVHRTFIAGQIRMFQVVRFKYQPHVKAISTGEELININQKVVFEGFEIQGFHHIISTEQLSVIICVRFTLFFDSLEDLEEVEREFGDETGVKGVEPSNQFDFGKVQLGGVSWRMKKSLTSFTDFQGAFSSAYLAQ